jgi:hypothetical protein
MRRLVGTIEVKRDVFSDIGEPPVVAAPHRGKKQRMRQE